MTRITRRLQASCCLAILVTFSATRGANAQETDDKVAPVATVQASAESTEQEAGQPAVKADPFALPENATAEELLEFIQSVKRIGGRTGESVSKSARAIVAGAEAIRELDEVELDIEIKAIREELVALHFLQRLPGESSAQLQSLISNLKNDQRNEIARIGAIEAFKLASVGVRVASQERLLEMIAEFKELLANYEFDRELYTIATRLARAIGYSGHTEVAASLYEDLARWTAGASDKALRERTDKMIGSARRMRLPGKFMEVSGTTISGEDFDWDAYRGKVVLVDFWASWCGPCRAEIPNMKRNLEAYRDRGFEIVGINLDYKLEACQDFLQREELTWTNLMSDKDGERGWDNPLASYYGIFAIPTAILVDQDGKVVSLTARGTELDRWLARLLGPPAASEPESKVAKNESDG